MVLLATALSPVSPDSVFLPAFSPGLSSASAQGATRSLIVVGDSIVLSASEELVASAPADWTVQINAEVSRPTNVGHDVVRANLAAITDTLVIGLGANDAASPDVFQRRASALLADVAAVPHVFWIEVAEVRDYYPVANAAIRELAAAYPNVSIVPWTALATANPGLTAADGLHLTGPGQQALADAILTAVIPTAAPPGGSAGGLLAEIETATQDASPAGAAEPAGLSPAQLVLVLAPFRSTVDRLRATIAGRF